MRLLFISPLCFLPLNLCISDISLAQFFLPLGIALALPFAFPSSSSLFLVKLQKYLTKVCQTKELFGLGNIGAGIAEVKKIKK